MFLRPTRICSAEELRAVVAIVSLFQRPVATGVVLELGGSEALGCVLASWNHEDVREAVQHPLSGLLTWHTDQTISAHPLVRDSFRPLALNPDSAQLASHLALDALPAGWVRSRDHAMRVVEIIELLLDEDQWEAADQIYRGRTGDGKVFVYGVPAAALGQRCALAFVATQGRRDMCQRQLSFSRLGLYLNDVGLFGMFSGDIETAEQYLQAVVRHDRADVDLAKLAAALRNWAECLTWLGRTGLARDPIDEALAITQGLNDPIKLRNTRAGAARVYDVAGDTVQAEAQYMDADRLEYNRSTPRKHLYSFRGSSWAHLLLRTGREHVARRLTKGNHAIAYRNGWRADIARCDWVFGLCDLADNHLEPAGRHLRAAEATFRSGDYLLVARGHSSLSPSSNGGAAGSMKLSARASRRSSSPRRGGLSRRTPQDSPSEPASVRTGMPLRAVRLIWTMRATTLTMP